MFLHCGGACIYKSQSLSKQDIQKNVCLNFQFFQPFEKLPSCVLVGFIIGINMYKGISKHSWKKIVQLLWTIATYLLKNVECGIEHNIAYGVCIGLLDIHFWTL